MIKRTIIVGAAILLCCAPHVSAQNEKMLSLDNLFQLVEANSKNLQAEKQGAEAASESVEAAKSQRLPDLNTSLSASYLGNALMVGRHFGYAHGLHSPHFGNSFSLEAQQLVYAGGAINAGIEKAQIAQSLTNVNIRQTREDERFVAVSQWLDLFQKDNSLKVVNKNIELTEQLLSQIKDKQSQGLALKNDITRYELQMEQLKLRQTQLINERNICNHQLVNTLGLPQDTKVLTDSTIVTQALGREQEDYWQQMATTQAPMLERARLQEQLAEKDVKLAKSEQRPKVSVFAADNFNGPITYELPPINKNINVWYVGVGVSYPISSLYKSNHKVKQAKALQQQAVRKTAAAAQQLNNSVQQAHTLYEQSYIELKTQEKSRQLAEQNYGVMRERYLNQLVLVTDMLDASNTLLDAQLKETDAQIAIAFSYFRMKYLAGTL